MSKQAPIKQRVVEALQSGAENCPNCPNRGWWQALDEQHQCEWCYTVPHSRFNIDALASELADKAIVPVEPTGAMLLAAEDECEAIDASPEDEQNATLALARIYRAMLRASDEQ